MLEKIKNGLGKPAGWMYFILVVALLIIVSNNGDKVDNLQADLDSANTEISTLETTLEAAANEIAVRDDAIAGFLSRNSLVASADGPPAMMMALGLFFLYHSAFFSTVSMFHP